jgi:hypothetical protein
MLEYKVIPAPRKPQRSKGAKTTTERFAVGLEATLNEMGAAGWSFVRAETLPVDERHGFMRKVVEEFHTVLVFCRPQVTQSAPEPAEHRRPVFFADKEPPASAAPSLGAATDTGPAVKTGVRAEKDAPEPDTKPDKPARKPPGKAKK